MNCQRPRKSEGKYSEHFTSEGGLLLMEKAAHPSWPCVVQPKEAKVCVEHKQRRAADSRSEEREQMSKVNI